MALHDFLAQRQPNASARVFFTSVEALEDQKDTIEVFGWNANAVVADGKFPAGNSALFWQAAGRDMNLRGLLTTKLNGVADEILQELGELHWIPFHRRQGLRLYLRSTFFDGDLQVQQRVFENLTDVGWRKGLAGCADARISQEVANQLVVEGVTGILNFAPIVLSVPEDVTVNNVNLAIELENLSYFIQT